MPDQQDAIASTPLPDATPTAGPGHAPRPPAETCREVEQTLAREPGDRVRCVHLFGDYYRCNWWSRVGTPREVGGFDWAGLLTDHVRRSRLLRVTTASGRLHIDEVQEPARAGRSPV